jgi:hypothetical protein
MMVAAGHGKSATGSARKKDGLTDTLGPAKSW